MRPFFTVIVALALPACAPMNAASTAPAAPPDATQDMCNAGRVQTLVGQVLTPEMPDQIRAQTGAGSVRVIAPNAAVTMDYRGDRINIEHDARMKILAIRCG